MSTVVASTLTPFRCSLSLVCQLATAALLSVVATESACCLRICVIPVLCCRGLSLSAPCCPLLAALTHTLLALALFYAEPREQMVDSECVGSRNLTAMQQCDAQCITHASLMGLCYFSAQSMGEEIISSLKMATTS